MHRRLELAAIGSRNTALPVTCSVVHYIVETVFALVGVCIVTKTREIIPEQQWAIITFFLDIAVHEIGRETLC